MMNSHLQPLLEKTEFATMFYGIIDIAANCLMYASAGVPAPVLCARGKAAPICLDGRGFPLGMLPHAVYETQYTAFMPGDLLVFFSDCLVETRNAKGEFISDAAIQRSLQKTMLREGDYAQSAIEDLRQLLASHSCAPLMDDMTINAYWRRG